MSIKLKDEGQVKLKITNEDINKIINAYYNTIKVELFKKGILINSEIKENILVLEYIDENNFSIDFNFLYLKIEKFIIGKYVKKGVLKKIKSGAKSMFDSIKNGVASWFKKKEKEEEKDEKKEKEEEDIEDYTLKEIEAFYHNKHRPKTIYFLYNCIEQKKDKNLKLYFTKIKNESNFHFKNIQFNHKCLKSIYAGYFNIKSSFIFWLAKSFYSTFKKLVSKIVNNYMYKQYNIDINNLNNYSIDINKFEIEKDDTDDEDDDGDEDDEDEEVEEENKGNSKDKNKDNSDSNNNNNKNNDKNKIRILTNENTNNKVSNKKNDNSKDDEEKKDEKVKFKIKLELNVFKN